MYFIPYFDLNLIFIPKITQKLECEIIFNENNCVLQRRRMKSKIGSGRKVNNLYVFNKDLREQGTALNALVKKRESSKLWHFRLDHLIQPGTN